LHARRDGEAHRREVLDVVVGDDLELVRVLLEIVLPVAAEGVEERPAPRSMKSRKRML
jgi:hypothetical protein